VRLEKFIELHARAEAEQPAQFGLGQVAELEFFEGQRFERAALDLATVPRRRARSSGMRTVISV